MLFYTRGQTQLTREELLKSPAARERVPPRPQPFRMAALPHPPTTCVAVGANEEESGPDSGEEGPDGRRALQDEGVDADGLGGEARAGAAAKGAAVTRQGECWWHDEHGERTARWRLCRYTSARACVLPPLRAARSALARVRRGPFFPPFIAFRTASYAPPPNNEHGRPKGAPSWHRWRSALPATPHCHSTTG